MKRLLFLLLFAPLTEIQAQHTAETTVQQLSRLLKEKRLPELEGALQAGNRYSLDDATKKLFTGALQNAWMQAGASQKTLNSLSKKEKSWLPDSLLYLYHRTQLDNAIKLFDYKQAASLSDLLAAKFAAYYPGDELEGLKTSGSIWRHMLQQPRQQVQHNGTATVKTKRDLAGLLNIPVQSGDSTYAFVFDTGAGISTIMESFARKLDLQFLPGATVPIRSGITGIATQSQLAVAKELRIGTTVVKHALFLVFPDSALTFGGGVYKIQGIIGFPIIKELGTLGFRKDTLDIQPSITTGQPRNLAADILKPYIFLQHKGRLLPFAFDTGAMQTIFSNRFYTQHKEWIDATGKAGTQPLAAPMAISSSRDLCCRPWHWNTMARQSL